MNRRVSLFALVVLLVASAVQALTAVLYLGPMLILNSGSSLSAFTAEQLHALAYTFIGLNGYAFDTHLVLFGLWCLLTGFLIFRCTFTPRGNVRRLFHPRCVCRRNRSRKFLRLAPSEVLDLHLV